MSVMPPINPPVIPSAVSSIVAGLNLTGGTITTSGTIGLQASPTIQVTPGTGPLLLNSNTSGSPPSYQTGAEFVINAKDVSTSRMQFNGYSGSTIFQGTRSGGTQGTMTAIPAGTIIASFGGSGYDGTSYAAVSGLQIIASQTQSPGAHGQMTALTYIANNTTSVATGASMQQSGDFTVGTTSDVTGAGKLQVVGGALVDVLNLGTVSGGPQIIQITGAPTGTATVATLAIRNNGSLNAGLYFANAGSSFNPVSGV